MIKKLVGVIYANKRENIYYIDDIVVKSTYQNQGIATALFKYVEQMAGVLMNQKWDIHLKRYVMKKY